MKISLSVLCFSLGAALSVMKIAGSITIGWAAIIAITLFPIFLFVIGLGFVIVKASMLISEVAKHPERFEKTILPNGNTRYTKKR